MRILGTICARGGSKGVKNKNIRNLDGRPLIYYTIKAMKKWGKADRIICSTDSPEIAKIASEYGAETPFLRPAELSSDTAPKIPVIKHALRYCEEEEGINYDTIVDLDPTSPLRTTNDIERALQKFLNTRADVLYSVTEAKKNPYFNMVELDDNDNAHLSKKLEGEFFRRQDTPKVYEINGSIYIYNRDYLSKANGLHCENERVFVMDEISSIDIDREIDFRFIEYLLKSGLFKFD
ncbi:MAG: cytidylyltransferase domain-containing protein [Candidatus Thorarchaeota archaeon]